MDEPVIKAVKGEHYTGNDFFEEMKRRFKEEQVFARQVSAHGRPEALTPKRVAPRSVR